MSQKDSGDTASCGNLSDSPTIANGDDILSVGLAIFPVCYCLTLVLCFGGSQKGKWHLITPLRQSLCHHTVSHSYLCLRTHVGSGEMQCKSSGKIFDTWQSKSPEIQFTIYNSYAASVLGDLAIQDSINITHLAIGYTRDIICNNTPMVLWEFFLGVF
ncbi:hypothetical protein VN97_g3380 [Penicillium thymicola]|uniref:Uncharacterized protein n=1 Tax=Penicillium thymicola TaxID=293382 RepID=A0AAI9TMR6_PENTH|nr:hypothetical protein VN97_g3380 [Penicillium thymicola]